MKSSDLRNDPDALSSYAILCVNYELVGQDYIEVFVPFVADVLRDLRKEKVSASEVQEKLEERLALSIPIGPIQAILSRAESEEYVEKQNGHWWPNYEKLSELRIEQERRGYKRENRALVQKLISYCRSEFDRVWSREEATEALHSYVQTFSATVVRRAETGGALKHENKGEKGEQYQLQRFIYHLDQEDPEGFKYLLNLAKGSMLASVLTFDNLDDSKSSFNGVSFYFDTPFILDLVGLNGKEVSTPCKELIRLLRSQGAKLRILERTLHETLGVLEGTCNDLAPGQGARRGKLARVDPALSRSDVRVMAQTLETTLESEYAIHEKESPDYVDLYGVDENALGDLLQEEIGYNSDITRKHDVQALAAIKQLRRGQMPNRLTRAKAVFVTTNGTLVQASKKFFTGEESAHAPIALYHHTLTTRVWLRSPGEASDLPRVQIVADALAALKPDEDLWAKYLEKIESLKQRGELSEEQYQAMRYTSEGRLSLTEATQNDPQALRSQNIIDEIWARTESKAQAPLKKELAEREDELAQLQNAKRQAEEEISEQREELEERDIEAQTNHERLLNVVENIRGRVESRFNRSLGAITAVVLAVIGVLLWLGLSPGVLSLIGGVVMASLILWGAVTHGASLATKEGQLSFIQGKSLKWIKERTYQETVKLVGDEKKAGELITEVFAERKSSN